ncbi:metallophosphoesterase [Microbulbifer spongiae]|uniref:Metallophosphoesterase n=1 Tax=Microbulbifer spongiae TaxID=2944933 RepID=A0ABY9EFG2_9GAMM|nr:metallophosphoesterase [Microbulbifer sp. MI-G]WKD50284.1 metallophosphoesterase [Microbulbifer sp. MI-G]
MSIILTNLKHFGITFIVLITGVVAFGLFIGADAHLFENKLAYKLDGEVHVFYDNNTLVTKTLRGNKDDGYYVDTSTLSEDETLIFPVSFPLDNSTFNVTIDPEITIPDTTYNDGESIIALSDIESGFSAFREFLVIHGVADTHLNWTFDRGHLVLVGDFVDRGASTTQILWGIYKLEQSAKGAGGKVHFIIGNHEIKNLQGNYQSAQKKYFYIAGMLGKQQYQLFDDNAFLGRWLSSKNVLEVINSVAFTHGGIHPRITEFGLSLSDINSIVRKGYRRLYYTPTLETKESFLQSSTTGPAWYRGYFKDNLSQPEVEQSLKAVKAKAVVVGHTLQSKINTLYNKKVIAIDVKHPKDYLFSLPFRKSEGLLVKNGKYFRLLENGEAKEI